MLRNRSYVQRDADSSVRDTRASASCCYPALSGKTSAIRVMSSHPAMTAFALNFSDENADDGTLSSLFEAVGRNAPSLVIFKRPRPALRAVCRSVVPHNRSRITFQHLLGCLEGLVSQDGVIFVATANDPTALDMAILRRPGRFDRVVVFPRSASSLRVAYLQRLVRETLEPEVAQRDAAETDASRLFSSARRTLWRVRPPFGARMSWGLRRVSSRASDWCVARRVRPEVELTG